MKTPYLPVKQEKGRKEVLILRRCRRKRKNQRPRNVPIGIVKTENRSIQEWGGKG